MKKWRKASFLCLPALALGVSVWAAPRWQNKDTTPTRKAQKSATPDEEAIPSVSAAKSIHDRLLKTRKKRLPQGMCPAASVRHAIFAFHIWLCASAARIL